MRGEREEDGKVISPMFPRLHINDADKGGPRAPPRNKMALYEQLTVPSKRFKPASVPTFPMPPLKVDVTVPSALPSQDCGHERSTASSYHSSPLIPSRPSEKAALHPIGWKNSSVRIHESEKGSTEHVTRGSGYCSGHAQASSCDSVRAMSSRGCEDDDFTVPRSIQPENGTPGRNLAIMEQNLRLVKDQESPLLRPVITDINLNESENNFLEKKCKENVSIKDQNRKPTSHIRSEERSLETCNAQKESYNKESARTALVNEQTSHNNGEKPQEGSYCDGNLGKLRCSTDTEVGENRDTSSLGEMPGPKVTNDSSPAAEKRREMVDNINELVGIDSAQRSCDVSETSTLDSDSGLNLSPDEVVGVIGPKHFWKARRAIVNQQRIFAVQVFELHRLIKVQKLFAASPALLLEESPFLHGSFRICRKNDSFKQNEKALPQNVKRKGDLQKTDNSVHLENTQNMLPVPTQDVNPVGQVSQDGPSPRNPTSMPMISENQTSPWCFQPANNQWLIPVMSPSEGLVYKPCMGPSPPLSGFVTPVYYGGYSPPAMPPISGSFMNAAYGIPASYPKNFSMVPANPTVSSPHYLQVPHVHPVENTRSPSLPHDQTKPSKGTSHNDRVVVSGSRNEACSGSSHKIPASMESESHLNSASSENVRQQGSHFKLSSFSDRTLNIHHQSNSPTVVIRVVPHNANCATESAARIFRSIQKERQQHD